MTFVRVGLISDTHGLLRPAALEFLRGCHLILHAGDICDSSVLERLSEVAPTTAVRGNNDTAAWVRNLRETEVVETGGLRILVIHDIGQMHIPAEEGVDIVVFGHSHKPSVQTRSGVLFVNPGSAGPRRFKLPVSVGELLIEGGHASPRLVDLATSTCAKGP